MDKIEVGTRLVEKATGSFSAVEAVFRAKQIGGDEIVTFYKIRGQFLVAYPYDELSKYYMLPIGGEQPMNAREDLILIAAEATEAMKAAKSLLENEMRTNDLLRDQLAEQKRQAEHRVEELRLELESTNKELVEKMHEVWSLAAWQSGEVRGLANLLAAMSGSIDNDNEPEWLKMAVAGEKIAAIKLIRSTEHYSLLFCKNLVELIVALAKYWEVE